MLEDVPFERALGKEIGGWAKEYLESLGIKFHAASSLARFDGDGERVTKVVLESGEEIDADVVVIGAGVHPDTMLAQQAGLEIGPRKGILCTSKL